MKYVHFINFFDCTKHLYLHQNFLHWINKRVFLIERKVFLKMISSRIKPWKINLNVILAFYFTRKMLNANLKFLLEDPSCHEKINRKQLLYKQKQEKRTFQIASLKFLMKKQNFTSNKAIEMSTIKYRSSYLIRIQTSRFEWWIFSREFYEMKSASAFKWLNESFLRRFGKIGYCSKCIILK